VSAWPHGDPNAVIKQVLAERAYQKAPATGADAPVLRFWQEVFDWIGRLLHPFTHWLSNVFDSAHGVMTPLSILVVAVTVLAVVLLIVRIAFAFAKPRTATLEDSKFAGSLGGSRSAEAWRRFAANAASTGNYAGAVAALFAAALAALDERMLVPYDDSRTPGEYRRRVRAARAPAAPPFDVLADRFVHAAYAAEPTSHDDYDSALDAYARFVPLCEAA
jgi:hypothetical protein